MTEEAAVTSLLRRVKPDVSIKRFLWASAFRLGQGQSDAYRKGDGCLSGTLRTLWSLRGSGHDDRLARSVETGLETGAGV